MTDPAALAAEVLQQAAKVISRLTPEQLLAVASGEAQIAFVSAESVIGAKGRSRGAAPAASSPSIDDTVSQLPKMTDRAEAERFLSEGKLTIPQLKAVARALDITIPSKLTKAEIIRRLAEDTVGNQKKHEALLDGPYRR